LAPLLLLLLLLLLVLVVLMAPLPHHDKGGAARTGPGVLGGSRML
jgi:hypothetical protein